MGLQRVEYNSAIGFPSRAWGKNPSANVGDWQSTVHRVIESDATEVTLHTCTLTLSPITEVPYSSLLVFTAQLYSFIKAI